MATVKGNYSGSSTYDIYVSCVVNSQSIENNTSNVTFIFGMNKMEANSASYNLNNQTFTYKINGTTYTKSVKFDFRSAKVGSYNKLFSVTKNIAHSSDGTKTVSVSASHPTGIKLGTGKVSASFKLSTIPRKSSFSVNKSAYNLGEKITFIINRKSSSFTHKLTYTYGTGSGTISTKATTSAVFELANNLANLLPNASSGTMKITCATYKGSTHIGSNSLSVKVNIPNNSTFIPSTPNMVITPGKLCDGCYVQNISTVSAKISSTAKYKASIDNYTLYVGNKSYSDKSAEKKDKVINSSGTVYVYATVSDTRKFSSVCPKKSLTVYPYFNPTVKSLKLSRIKNSSSECLNLSFTTTFSSINNKNTLGFKLYYEDGNNQGTPVYFFEGKLNISDTASEDSIVNGIYNKTIINTSESVSENVSINIPNKEGVTFDRDKTYIISAEFYDFNTSYKIKQTFILKTEFVTVDLKSGGKSVAIGKSAETEDTFDIGLNNTYLSNDIYLGGDKRSTSVKSIHFNNAGSSNIKHDILLYGGNGDSNTAFGIKDNLDNSLPLVYDDKSKKFTFNKPIYYGAKSLTDSMTTLFTGSLAKGQKTGAIDGVTRYRIFYLSIKDYATAILAARNGTSLRGIGGYATNAPKTTFYAFGGTLTEVNGKYTISNDYCRAVAHTTGTSHSFGENLVIAGIYGVI